MWEFSRWQIFAWDLISRVFSKKLYFARINFRESFLENISRGLILESDDEQRTPRAQASPIIVAELSD